jgi:amino acid transporter
VNPRRDIPVAISRAGISQALMYGIPILAILIVLPAGQITSLHGLIDAIQAVLTSYGGSIGADGTAILSGWGQTLGWACAILFIWVLVASGSTWIMGAGRAQAAACLDGAGPRVLGRISARSGVPVIMGLVSGAISFLAMAVDLTVTGRDNQKYFSAALVVAITLVVLAYLLIFPAFVALRVREPGLNRPFRVPGGAGIAWLVAGLATGWSALAAVCLLWPGLGTADPDAALPAGFASQRFQFELLILAPIAAVIAAATAHHLATRIRSRRTPRSTARG